MAKYDWKQLEKEYISGNYKSINAFLKEKGIYFERKKLIHKLDINF